MREPKPTRVRPAAVCTALLALALLTLPSAAGASAHRFPRRVAKSAINLALGEKLLITTRGFTLYSLRQEKHHRFVCNRRCLGKWRPLTVGPRTIPKGPVKLGTVRRPDGRTQVTYRGHPLYTFEDDHRPGDANGEGVEDVGTWHAATLKR